MLLNYRAGVDRMARAYRQYPWESKLAYAQYLAQTYYYVCHSTRLLAAAAARFSQIDQSMHRRFLKHTSEENSHELLALRDLQALGFRIEEFPELAQTRTFYEVQYYKIEHQDPAALLGYILALETLAGEELKNTKEKLVRLYGSEAVRFIQVHADEDPDHIEKALRLIESLPSYRLDLIDRSLEQAALSFVDLLQAAKTQAFGDGKRNAA